MTKQQKPAFQRLRAQMNAKVAANVDLLAGLHLPGVFTCRGEAYRALVGELRAHDDQKELK